MHYKHIMLEVYCNKDKGDCNLFPCGVNHCCFINGCKDMKFAICPNEFAYTDENGIASTWIGFGGDMDFSQDDDQHSKLITKWKVICEKQINNAYEQYMSDKP